jgi:hypothetical protein
MMTVAGLIHRRHKSKPPALDALAACNWYPADSDSAFASLQRGDCRLRPPLLGNGTSTGGSTTGEGAAGLQRPHAWYP